MKRGNECYIKIYNYTHIYQNSILNMYSSFIFKISFSKSINILGLHRISRRNRKERNVEIRKRSRRIMERSKDYILRGEEKNFIF